jgi:two-component system, chemotaxis family, response regulator Rcp1
MMANRPRHGPIDILLVEDNPGDVRLTREALKEARVRNTVHVVPDGVEAMAFFRRQGPYVSAPRPDLVLLDLSLPKKDGRTVLAEVKSDPDLRRIPVVVLTTSRAERDILGAYDLHANAYVAKPVDFERYAVVVESIEDFWLDAVTLPSSPE